jgi:hypothetical protein
MKKIIAITSAALLLICFSTASAHAGAARRHTIEGFMLGTGVAILGAAIINEMNKCPVPQYTRRNEYHRYAGYSYRYHHRPRGHWEVDKTWNEPVYEKKWNPGHYNHHGDWINGRYEKFMIKDGYWQEERVWVWH